MKQLSILLQERHEQSFFKSSRVAVSGCAWPRTVAGCADSELSDTESKAEPAAGGAEGEQSRHILPLSGDGDVLQPHYVVSAYAVARVPDGFCR